MVQDQTVEDCSKKAASDQVALLVNGTGQKNRGLSLKKEKEKKKKKPKLDDVCYNCEDLGYWRNQLAYPKCKEQEGQYSGSANVIVDQLKQLEEHKVSKVLMAVEGAIVGDGLILDCGTTIYMFAERVYFKSLKSKKSGIRVEDSKY